MAVAGDIVARLLADTRPFSRDLKNAGSMLNSFRSTALKALGGLTAGFTMAKVVSDVTSAIHQQINAVDELANTAQRLSIPIEQLTTLQRVAKMNDVEFSALSTGITKMMRNIAEANGGAKGPGDALKRIGLSARDLIKLGADQQLAKIADGISGLENPTIRVQTAMDLFGKSGAELLNVLTSGSKGIREAADATRDFGTAISALDASNISAADDAMKDADDATIGLARTLTAQLAPAIKEAASGFASFVSQFKTPIREFGQAFNFMAAKAGTFLGRLTALKLLLKGDLKGFKFAQNFADMEGAAIDEWWKHRNDPEAPKVAGDKPIFGPIFDEEAAAERDGAAADIFRRAKLAIEQVKSPIEKLREQWTEMQDLFDQGLIPEDTLFLQFARIQEEMRKLDGPQAKSFGKAGTPETALRGSGSAVSILNAAGNADMKSVQNKQLQQQQQANKHLEKISQNVGTIAATGIMTLESFP